MSNLRHYGQASFNAFPTYHELEVMSSMQDSYLQQLDTNFSFMSRHHALDQATIDHCYRVGRFAARFAYANGIVHTAEEIQLLLMMGGSHDIGKADEQIGELTRLPSRLTDEQKAIVDRHSMLGAEMLAAHPYQGSRGSELTAFAILAAAYHHGKDKADEQRVIELIGAHTTRPERLLARNSESMQMVIAVSVADIFDALWYKRPYSTKRLAEEGHTKQLNLETTSEIIGDELRKNFADVPGVNKLINRTAEYLFGNAWQLEQSRNTYLETYDRVHQINNVVVNFFDVVRSSRSTPTLLTVDDNITVAA